MKTKAHFDGWVLKDKAGNFFPETFAPTKRECWDYSFLFVGNKEGLAWINKYDSRECCEAAMKAAFRRGWSIVPVHLVEVEKCDSHAPRNKKV